MAFCLLFSLMCVDELSQQLNVCHTGCVVDSVLINHRMYVEVLVILCLYTDASQQLLRVCSQYGRNSDANESNAVIA